MPRAALCFCSCLILVTAYGLGQEVERNQQAITLAAQSVAAAGGPSLLRLDEGFKATGDITFFWAGEPVAGAVTLYGKGSSQFRLDATLPEGLRSVRINAEGGTVRDPNGQVKILAQHNTRNAQLCIVPAFVLLRALQDTSVAFSYIGLESKNGHSIHHIRTQRHFPNDPRNTIGRLTKVDFYLDALTLQILAVADAVHPVNQSSVDFPHEFQFAEYRTVEGLAIPFDITEIQSGQRTLQIKLSHFSQDSPSVNADFDLDR